VLVTLADVARRSLRAPDMICRYGGEEFLILMPEVALPRARVAGERLREIARACKVLARQEEIAVTISVGVASREGADSVSLDALIDHADQALYAAKRAGRNCVMDYRPAPHLSEEQEQH
jgi:diguanylate cyclase (GGDEF)-like protein